MAEQEQAEPKFKKGELVEVNIRQGFTTMQPKWIKVYIQEIVEDEYGNTGKPMYKTTGGIYVEEALRRVVYKPMEDKDENSG